MSCLRDDYFQKNSPYIGAHSLKTQALTIHHSPPLSFQKNQLKGIQRKSYIAREHSPFKRIGHSAQVIPKLGISYFSQWICE